MLSNIYLLLMGSNSLADSSQPTTVEEIIVKQFSSVAVLNLYGTRGGN